MHQRGSAGDLSKPEKESAEEKAGRPRAQSEGHTEKRINEKEQSLRNLWAPLGPAVTHISSRRGKKRQKGYLKKQWPKTCKFEEKHYRHILEAL